MLSLWLRGRSVLFCCLLALLLNLALYPLSKLSKTRAIFGHWTVLVHHIPTYYYFLFVIATKKTCLHLNLRIFFFLAWQEMFLSGFFSDAFTKVSDRFCKYSWLRGLGSGSLIGKSYSRCLHMGVILQAGHNQIMLLGSRLPVRRRTGLP